MNDYIILFKETTNQIDQICFNKSMHGMTDAKRRERGRSFFAGVGAMQIRSKVTTLKLDRKNGGKGIT